MAVSPRAQLEAAIAAYESDPNKSQWPTETLRNMMMAAQEEGIMWQPHFSMKRAGMSLLDGLLLGFLPGDHALTSGERMAGGVGDVASFALPYLAAAKGLKAGTKALGWATGTGAKTMRGAAAAGFDALEGGTRSAAAFRMGKATQAADAAAEAAGVPASMSRRLIGKSDDALAKALSREAKAEDALSKVSDRYAKARSKTEDLLNRTAQRIQRSEEVNGAIARVIRNGADFATAGAIHGGLKGLPEGDPIGSAFDGAMGYGALGAIGGAALTPAIQQMLMRHKTLTMMGAGGLGLGIAANSY